MNGGKAMKPENIMRAGEKMISINSPLQQDKIIELLENQDGQFTFIDKKGIKLLFETTIEDKTVAARLARETIKKESWSTGLYFHAIAE